MAGVVGSRIDLIFVISELYYMKEAADILL